MAIDRSDLQPYVILLQVSEHGECVPTLTGVARLLQIDRERADYLVEVALVVFPRRDRKVRDWNDSVGHRSTSAVGTKVNPRSAEPPTNTEASGLYAQCDRPSTQADIDLIGELLDRC